MRGAWILAGLFASVFPLPAFVLNLNTAGEPRRWKLDPPDLDVSTNIVNPTTKAIRYFLASDAYSSTNTAAELNAVRAAFAQWQSVPGTRLKFEDAGLIAPVTDVNTDDGTNVVFWARITLVNGGLDDIRGILGATYTSSLNETLAEADIVLNGVDYQWFTDFNSPSSSGQFVEGVALHEIGHFIGLLHSPVGGATMFFRGGSGVNQQAGLEADEIAAVRWLYAQPTNTAAFGRVQGQIRMNGSPVFGASVVIEEDASGNLIAGTVSRADGTYELPALPAGAYRLRVTPLDPADASRFLARGRDIDNHKDGSGNFIYDAIETDFLSTTNFALTVAPGATTTRDFTVASGPPAFRISRISKMDSSGGSTSSLPVAARPGETDLMIGVGSETLPTNAATLSITGDGLTLGATTFQTLGSLNFLRVSVSVAGDATAGLRSLVVQRGKDVAYANGFVEILPRIPDYNFDGLDDRFQRRYFPLFTSAPAAPAADPDRDGFDNQAEYLSGTNPTNTLSLLRIESVRLDSRGSTITWQSGAGKRYQVWSRREVENDPWRMVGAPLEGTGELTQFTDTSATNEFRFYRVQALP